MMMMMMMMFFLNALGKPRSHLCVYRCFAERAASVQMAATCRCMKVALYRPGRGGC